MKSIDQTRSTKEKQTLKSFKCSKCNFETNSQIGLKIHDKKKHTSLEIEIEKYPRSCNLCDKVSRNAAEMKKHVISHSYTKANFKCDDCDFVGESEYTMEVHIGKFHSEKYECGICDIEVKDLKAL